MKRWSNYFDTKLAGGFGERQDCLGSGCTAPWWKLKICCGTRHRADETLEVTSHRHREPTTTIRVDTVRVRDPFRSEQRLAGHERPFVVIDSEPETSFYDVEDFILRDVNMERRRIIFRSEVFKHRDAVHAAAAVRNAHGNQRV